MTAGPGRNRARTGPPSARSRETRPGPSQSNPMDISSIINHDNQVEQEAVIRPRSHSIQLPPLQRSADANRQPTDAFINGPGYTSTSSFAVRPISNGPSSPTGSESLTARAPRPKYEIEQAFFIWYHRTDLGLPWDVVLAKYRAQFQQERQKTGLQCRFYRLLTDWKVEKVRAQSRNAQNSSGDKVGAYGVVQRTWHRFAWMSREHWHQEPLPQFRNRGQSPVNNSRSTCECCSHSSHRSVQRG